MKTQPERVLEILKQRRRIGVTSQELRDITHVVDVPKAISLLREQGHTITDKAVKLGKSTIKRYWLGDSEKKPIRVEWDNKRGVAVIYD